MRVDLPSGEWVEVREELKAGDQFAAQDAATFAIADGRQQSVSAGMTNQMRLALLGRIITNWSYAENGIPIPANNPGGTAIIGDVMSIDDWNTLRAETEHLFAKVGFQADRPN